LTWVRGEGIVPVDLKGYLGNGGCGQPTEWNITNAIRVNGNPEVVPGVVLDRRTGVMSGTPSQQTDWGPVEVMVEASNGAGWDTIMLRVRVNPGLEAPRFSKQEEWISKNEREEFSVDLSSYNVGGRVESWSWQGRLPSGVGFNNGVISGRTDQVGRYSVTATGRNRVGHGVMVVYLDILRVHGKPVITGPAVVSGQVGKEIVVKPTVVGEIYGNDGRTNWEVVGGDFPSGVSIHPSSGMITGLPGVSGAGQGQEVAIRVLGPGGWSDPFTMVFNIRQAKPVIDVDMREVSGIAGRTLRHPRLSGGIIGGPLERWMALGVDRVPGLSFDELTGEFSGVVERAGTYDVVVVGVGPTGELSDELRIRYRIADRLENPRLVNPGNRMYEVREEITPFRIGNEGGPVETWSLLMGQEAGLTIHPETGEISGRVWNAGFYTVEVLGSNAQGSGKVSFRMTVRHAKPVITGPRVITARPNQQIDEVVTVDTSRGAPKRWVAEGLPSGLRVHEFTYYWLSPVDSTQAVVTGARIQGKLGTPGRYSLTLYAESAGATSDRGYAPELGQRSDPFRVEVEVVDEPHNEIEWGVYEHEFDEEAGLPLVHLNGQVGRAFPAANAWDRRFVMNVAPEPSSVVSVRHTGNMPPGVTYQAMDNGVVFLGTPTVAGNYRAIIYGRNKDGKEKGFVLVAKILGMPKEIRFTNLPQTLKLKEGQEVNFEVGVTPSNARVRVVESDLPPYLSYNEQTRRLTGRVPLRTSGIPLRTWMPYYANFVAELDDEVSQPQGASLFIEIELDPTRDPKPPVPQPPTTLPIAYIGEPYQAIITAVPRPTEIGVLQPELLPLGLTANMDSQNRLVISGTPSHLNMVMQTWFEVQGTNADGPGPKVGYGIKLEPGRPFGLQSPITSTGQRGVEYKFNVAASNTVAAGGEIRIYGINIFDPSHSVQLTPINGSPTLAALGLKLNSNQIPIGEISGTPTQSGTFRYRVTATNQRGTNTQPIEFHLTIGEGAPLFPYPNGHTLTVYEDEPVALEIPVGSNPQSIQLNANLSQSGLLAAVQGNRITISGIPQIVHGQNTLQFSATAQNPIGTTSVTYTIKIEPGRPVRAPRPPITLTAGQSSTLTLNLQRGATPLTYTLTPIDGTPSLGQLGWTFNPNTGTLNINTTNTPPGQYRFEASATNIRGTSLNTPEFSIFVTAQPVPVILPPYSFNFTQGVGIQPTQINATNNPTRYTLVPVGNAPMLPFLGLSFNPITGVISGTPLIGTARSQPYLYTVSATNAGGTGPESMISILISAPLPPTILAPLQFTVTEGQPASGIMINATNNPTNFTVTPANANTPPLSQLGLVLNPATGQINGTPFVGTASTTPYQYQVVANNSTGSSLPATILIYVNVNTTLLPVLQPPYNATFLANQPITPFVFTATNNPAYIEIVTGLSTQAPGLTLQGNQFTLTGTPSQTGTYTYVIRARNTANTAWGPNQTYTFAVIAPTTITGPATITANVNQPINQPITFTGNPQGYNLTVTPSNPGISITGNTITGTPTQPGTYTLTLTPLINNNQPAGAPFTSTLTVRPVITGPGTISGTVNLPLTGGTMQTQGNPTLTAASSTTAPGITFSGGAFTGTPTTAGTYSYTVTGTANGVQSQPFTVTLQIVQPPPVLSANNTYTFTIGQNVNQQIPVTNGPATFTVAPAFNIPGLTLSPTGLISGTPAPPANTYTYTIQANNGTPSNSANLSITIVQPSLPTAIIQAATLRRNHAGTPYGLPLAIGGNIPTSDPRQGSQAVLRIQVPASFIPVNAATVQLIQGNATVGTVQTYGNNLIDVPLTINANNQRITIKINSINSTTITGNNQISFRVVRGDVNGNGVTNSLDISLINGALNQTTSTANFTRDINLDGVINNADITAAQSNLGGSAP
jgi:hypothetical protein